MSIGCPNFCKIQELLFEISDSLQIFDQVTKMAVVFDGDKLVIAGRVVRDTAWPVGTIFLFLCYIV